jgi:hypothetical protein
MRTKHWEMAFYILVERGVLARALEYALPVRILGHVEGKFGYTWDSGT